MKDYRKVIFVALFLGVIVFMPDMTATQVELMQWLIVAAFGGNGLEHVKEMVTKRGKVSGGTADGPVRAVRPVTAAQQAPAGGRNTH